MFPVSQSVSGPSSRSTRGEPGGAGQPNRDASPQSVVLHLLRAVREPAWAPPQAAERLLEHVDDALVLRRARAMLRVVRRHRMDPSHARAFATITMALNRLEDRGSPPSPSPLGPMASKGRP